MKNKNKSNFEIRKLISPAFGSSLSLKLQYIEEIRQNTTGSAQHNEFHEKTASNCVNLIVIAKLGYKSLC